MKQFAVLKKIGDFNASVVREFDNEEDAIQFANLLQGSEEKDYITYHVAHVQPICALSA